MKQLTLLIVFSMCGAVFLTADQSIHVKLGLFNPSQNSDLWEQNRYDLVLNNQDMMDLQFALEYERMLHRNFSFSLEGGYYEKEHLSQYRDWVDENDNPIYQNISLEIGYLELAFKFYPVGNRTLFFPYLGGGFGIYYWKYIQWGDFVDEELEVIYEGENAQTSTYTPGFNAKGGFVYRFQRGIGIGFEARYQHVKGELSSFFEGFEKFDLSGWTFSLGLNIYLR